MRCRNGNYTGTKIEFYKNSATVYTAVFSQYPVVIDAQYIYDEDRLILTIPDDLEFDNIGFPETHSYCIFEYWVWNATTEAWVIVVEFGAIVEPNGADIVGGYYTISNTAFWSLIPSFSLSITLTESLAAVDFLVLFHDVLTGELVAKKTLQAGAHTIKMPDSKPVIATVLPIQGDKWRASHVYAVNDLVFPTEPSTTPYYYKRINAGTSGTTEPTWVTTTGNQCNDGGVNNAWECVARLTQPITHSPLIAA